MSQDIIHNEKVGGLGLRRAHNKERDNINKAHRLKKKLDKQHEWEE